MDMDAPPVHRVDVGGLSVGYRRGGTGPPLVLLHGAYEDSRFWVRQLADLSDEFTVVAPDVPGFGSSDDPPETWTAAEYGDCLAGFLDVLGLRRPIVLGLSFGSVLALALYRQRPDAVGALVLASAYAGWAGSLPPEEVQRRLAQVRRELELPPEQILPTWLPTLLTPQASPHLVDLVAAMMRDFHPAGMRAALHGMGEVDLRRVLPTIAVPTLLLYGDADVRSPVSVAEDLHARIPTSTLVVIPGAPHLANLEQPDAFNAAVRRFTHNLPELPTTVTDQGLAAVCHRWIRALNTHDLDAAVDCFDEDYQDEAPARRGEQVRGRDHVRRNFQRLFTELPDLTATACNTVVGDQQVWLEWRMQGTRRDGTLMEFVGVNIFEVTHDRLRSGRIYTELVRDMGGIDAQLDRMATGEGL